MKFVWFFICIFCLYVFSAFVDIDWNMLFVNIYVLVVVFSVDRKDNPNFVLSNKYNDMYLFVYFRLLHHHWWKMDISLQKYWSRRKFQFVKFQKKAKSLLFHFLFAMKTCLFGFCSIFKCCLGIYPWNYTFSVQIIYTCYLVL